MRVSAMRRNLSALLGFSLIASAATASADVVLEPNTIQGNVRFTNVNPPVVTLLQQLGLTHAYVYAYSSAPNGYTSSTAATIGTPTDRAYELSAESGAGGPGGVTYMMHANAAIYAAPTYSVNGSYDFQPVTGVILQPTAQQPGGATADFEECIGIVRIRWGQDGTCDTPLQVNSGWINTSYSNSTFQNTAEHYVLQRGGTSETKTLYTTTGTDPSIDTLTFAMDVDLHPACDEIQDICIDMSGVMSGGGNNLGALKGPFDILGEVEEQSTYIRAYSGPNANQRYDYFTPPEMPISNPGSWWTLPNMMPGDYWAYASGLVRTGRQATAIDTPRLGPGMPAGPATVPAGATFDLQKNIGGQSRYPFVMTPAFFKGGVTLADPYLVGNLGAYSSLSALYFSTDPPTSSPYPTTGTALLAQDTQTWMGTSQTSFPGLFDPVTGLLSSSYEQLIVNPYDIPGDWRQSYLNLKFYDPVEQRNGDLYFQRDPTSHTMAPGDVVSIDHAYCFNEVVMGYSTTVGTLFNPQININGSFSGTDWQGNSTSYLAWGAFTGTPQGSAAAAPTGEVRFTLPQGTYVLQPSAGILSSSGGTSTASFKSTDLEVGCGQRITLTPGLSVSVKVPECAEDKQITIDGSVNSSGDPVDHIWVVVNGGAPIDICDSSCGPNPGYSAQVPLDSCTNMIEVFASVGGSVSSVTTQTVWDDPSDGVACGDGECAPEPAACADVKPEVIACGSGEQGSTGAYNLTLSITNNTSTAIVHVLLPDDHLSPHVVTLPAPLLPGASTTVDVSVSSVNPDSKQCFMVGFSDENHEECCSQKVCVEIPSCCFEVRKEKTECVPGAPAGTFMYGFSMVNRTTDVIEHVYLFPPSGVTASPDYVDVPSMVPGGVAFIGPITFAGATPGEKLCVEVGIHDEEMNQCCAEEICFEVPLCEDKDPATKDDAAGCAIGDSQGGTSAPYGVGLSLGVAMLARQLRRRRKTVSTKVRLAEP